MRHTLKALVAWLSLAILPPGCNQSSTPTALPVPQSEGSIDPASPGPPKGEASAEPASLPTTSDSRSLESVLCEEGPKLLQASAKDDFTEVLGLICSNGQSTGFFKELLRSSYSGGPQVQLFIPSFSTNEQYLTRLTLAYSVKVPLSDPSRLADLKLHDFFAAGVANGSSELAIKVLNRQSFPGKRAVEKIELQYDLLTANGAALADKRKTEFNTYLLLENNRDITLSTEHLLEAESNYFYHVARGLTVSVRADAQNSYIILLQELQVKNRIDPARLRVALSDLNKRVAQILVERIKG